MTSAIKQRNGKAKAATERKAAVKEALEQVRRGRTVPAEDVEAWIDSWDTAKELPKPTPKLR